MLDGSFVYTILALLNTFVNTRVAKTGDTMTGVLTISSSFPEMRLLRPGVVAQSWSVDSDSSMINRNTDNGQIYFRLLTNGQLNSISGWYIPTDGNLWMPWAGDYLSNKLGQKIDTLNGGRFDMAGTIAHTNYTDIVRGGVLRYRLLVDGSGNMLHQNGDNGDNFFYISTGGAVWTKQFGDLNQRIEDRASAWAATRQANLGFTPVKQGYNGNQVTLGWTGGGINMNVDSGGWDGSRILCMTQDGGVMNDIRWAYVGDHEANEYTALDGYHEPFSGAAVTGFKTNQLQTQVNGSIYAYLYAFRLRALQKRDNYGNWYNSYYI
jgi:hypothetical protein